jgi:hypothetical protein
MPAVSFVDPSHRVVVCSRELTLDEVKTSMSASNSPWRNDSECASEDEICGNEKWVLSGGQPGE